MLRKYLFTILLLMLMSILGYAQSEKNLKEINKVWAKFYEAFDSLDHKPMAEIHSKELIRISGGNRISDYAAYINGYERTFDQAREDKVTNNISLRFFERINNDSVASERGVYKLTRIKANSETQVFYGQFHVLFRKENAQWKILMDYDSSEGNTINEKAYLKAHAIDEFTKFIKD